MASAIIAQLLFLQAESSTRPIHIYINSPGTLIYFIKHSAITTSNIYVIIFQDNLI